MQHKIRHRGGFLLMDAVGALAILAALTVGFAVVATQQARAVAKLEDRRVAAELAERTLVNLQLGRKPAVPAEATAAGTRIDFKTADGGDAAAGRVWIVVKVERHGQRAEVFGLVPGEGR
jgi:hypothetical protein